MNEKYYKFVKGYMQSLYKLVSCVLTIALIASLTSCNTKKGSGNYEITAPISEPEAVSANEVTTSIKVETSLAGTTAYSTLFSSIDIKPLKTPPGLMVAEVRKVVEADNRFFLRSDGKVLIFDTNGKFLGKVDQKGEGPSQYRSLTDFIVDTLTHHVEVLDNYSFSVFTFDYTGKLVNHWTHGLLAFKFQKLDSDRYVFYTDKQLVATYPGRFQVYDRKRKQVIKSFAFIDKKRIKSENFLDVNNIYADSENILFSCSGNDTIFSFKLNNITPKYVFDFGKEGVPTDAFDDQSQNAVTFNEKRMKKDYTGLHYVSFAENKKIVIAQIVKGKKVFYLWLNKANNRYQLIDRFVDDLIFEGQRVPVSETFPTYFGNRHALRILEPESILIPLDSMERTMSKTDWKALLERNPKLKQLHDQVRLESNALIQVMTYR